MLCQVLVYPCHILGLRLLFVTRHRVWLGQTFLFYIVVERRTRALYAETSIIISIIIITRMVIFIFTSHSVAVDIILSRQSVIV